MRNIHASICRRTEVESAEDFTSNNKITSKKNAELQFFFCKCKEMLIQTAYKEQALSAGPKNSPPLHSTETCSTAIQVAVCDLLFYTDTQLKKINSHGHLILFLQIIVLLLDILICVSHAIMLPLLQK